MDAQMLRHFDQLHHCDVRYVKFNGSVLDLQALCHNDAFRAEVLVHEVVMVQIGQLA